MKTELELKDDLIETLNLYIKVLGEELSELVPLMSVRGWKSSRADIGLGLRGRIHALETKIKNLNQNESTG